MSDTPSPFDRPTTPKNSLELLRWFVFEPALLQRFSEGLMKRQVIMYYLRTLPLLLLLITH